MKSIKRKGVTLGLAATLALSPFLSSASFAAEKGLSERTYPQLENLQLNQFKASELKKNGHKQFSNNQLIIKYRSPLSASEHKKAGGKLVKRISNLGYDVIEVQGKKTLNEVANNYAKLGNVTSISRSAYGQTLAADPKASTMYHLNTLNLAKAQTLAGKNKVKVGVIDTGLDANHPELKNRLVANVNVMDPLKKGSADTHGTHVAGIIAGEKNNGVGGYGIAPNADIVSIDVSNRSFFITDYIVAEGILEAINQKVKVINMSLGFYFPSPILKDAVKKAVDSGIIVVAAAGNDGASVLNYPASFEGVISVGATDEKNQLAFFSTFGPSVDVVAPGQDVYAPVFDVDKGSSFVKMSGTSMASPVVAGAAALLLSKYPNLTPYQVNYMMTETAKDMGDKGYDLKYGYGMIDPVKLLSFDPKKIPADPSVKEKDILSKAKALGSFESKAVAGKIQKLNQTDYYKLDVQKDEYVQISLAGLEKYDMKLELLFFEQGKKTKTVDINDVGAGSNEGTLFQAPADGTLVMAVKDSFGKYDKNGQYTYKLSLQKDLEFVDDENTMEQPVHVSSLPYQSENHYFKDELVPLEEENLEENESTDEATEKEEPVVEEKEQEGTKEESDKEEFKGVPGDSDFFRFKLPGNEQDGMQVVKINLSGVAGIDSTIVLHYVQRENGEEMSYEMERSSFGGYGKGEELIFNGVPGQEYIIEVTNKPYIDEYMLMFGEVNIDYERSYSSMEPYQLSIESKVLPNDEDGLPLGLFDRPEESLAEGNIEKYQADKKALQDVIFTDEFVTFNNDNEEIMDAAIAINENETKNGYIQSYGDEDWYAFTPSHSSTFEVKIDDSYPIGMSVLRYNKELKDFDYLYSNEQYSMDGFSAATSFILGLQEGETYYFRANDIMYRPGYEKYGFTIKTKVKGTADANESNDTYEKATKVTTLPVYGNFSGISDTDMYYFKPGKASVYSIKLTPGTLPNMYKNVPSILKSEIDPAIVLIEDTNGNGKLEDEEQGKQIFIDYGVFGQEERGSLKTKKDAGYFIVTFDYNGINSSLIPYVFKIDETNLKDEDQGSTVKNNVPSKPVILKNEWKAKGYLNLLSGKGDTDYYKIYLSKAKTAKVTLEVPSDIDGKVTIYSSNGTQVAVLDSYGKGDHEIREVSLKKGVYYFKVEDVYGNASTDPYTLKIQ